MTKSRKYMKGDGIRNPVPARSGRLELYVNDERRELLQRACKRFPGKSFSEIMFRALQNYVEDHCDDE